VPSDASSAQPSSAAAARAQPLLVAHALTCRFGGVLALDEVDLSIDSGELLGIIGPNGAGKSTLFNVITGHVRPTSGHLNFRGQDITGMSPFRVARVGIVRKYQVPTVFQSLSVRQNLAVAASGRSSFRALFGRPTGIREKIAQLLDLLRLSPRADDEAGTLSHGERQWLEIGMVLANDPQLLLLDEPTAGMTTRETRETEALLRDLATGHTVAVIEHDIRFIREVARRVIVMHRGRILADGVIADIERNETVRDVYLGRSA
jgi:urea ABC transporter ATP-binding protein UrtD